MELTEAETEYAVNLVKHVYPGHIVFQFNCTNTISEQLLENVSCGRVVLGAKHLYAVIAYLQCIDVCFFCPSIPAFLHFYGIVCPV